MSVTRTVSLSMKCSCCCCCCCRGNDRDDCDDDVCVDDGGECSPHAEGEAWHRDDDDDDDEYLVIVVTVVNDEDARGLVDVDVEAANAAQCTRRGVGGRR